MNLGVTLTRADSIWMQYLDQEKISYQLADRPVKDLSSPEYSVLLVPDNISDDYDQFQGFLRSGGHLVVDKTNGSLQQHFKDSEQIHSIPFSIVEYSSKWESCEKKFIFDGTFVTEKVSRYPRKNIRTALASVIQEAFHAQGLPFVRLWYYPENYQSAFSFRWDLDEYEESDFRTMCRLIEGQAEAMTCFPSMVTYEDREQPLRQLRSLRVEIGSHGYVHHVYDNYRQNFINLTRAEELLKPYVDPIFGFSGPHGKGTPALLSVLEDKKYVYSSEFGYDYDNFPHFPVHRGRIFNVLQIPTHPVCEGVFLERHGYKQEMIDDYYEKMIDHKWAHQEMLFFYGHPTKRLGRYPQILENILKKINTKQQLWKTSFKAFADWWLMRHKTQMSYELKDKKIFAKMKAGDVKLNAEVVFPDNTRRIVSVQEMMRGFPVIGSSDRASLHRIEELLPVQEQEVQYGMFKKLKQTVKTFLDWEIKTPRRLLVVCDLSSFFKYGMRIVFDSFLTSKKNAA